MFNNNSDQSHKIVPIVLVCECGNDNNQCKCKFAQYGSLSKLFSKNNIFSVTKKISCTDPDLEPLIVTLLTGELRFVNKVIVTDNTTLVENLFQTIVKRCSISTNINTLKICLISTNQSEFINIVMNKLRILSIQKTFKIGSLIDHLDTTNIHHLLSLDHDVRCSVLKIIITSADIDDFIYDTRSTNTTFYTKREITRLFKPNLKKLEIRLVIDGKDTKNMSSMCQTILSMSPIHNDFIIGKIVIDILNGEKDQSIPISIPNDTFMETSVKYYDLSDPADDEELKRFRMFIKNISKKASQTIDININSIKWMYSLYKYQNCLEYTDVMSNIIMIMNSYPNPIKFDISILNRLIGSVLKSTSEGVECINILMKGTFALGSKRIMFHYMTLYGYMGSYKPWENIRHLNPFNSNDNDHYYKLPRHLYLNPSTQMIEHIMHFSDVITTSIHNLDNNLLCHSVSEKDVIVFIKHREIVLNHNFIHTIVSHYEIKCYDMEDGLPTTTINAKCIVYWMIDKITVDVNDDVMSKFSGKISIQVTDSFVDVNDAEIVTDYVLMIKKGFDYDYDYNSVSSSQKILVYPEIYDDTPNDQIGCCYVDIDNRKEEYDILIILDDKLVSAIDIDTLKYVCDVCSSLGLRLMVCHVMIVNNMESMNTHYLMQTLKDFTYVIETSYTEILKLVDNAKTIVTNIHNIIQYTACRYKPLLSIDGICRLDNTNTYDKIIIRMEGVSCKKRIRLVFRQIRDGQITKRYMNQLIQGRDTYCENSWESFAKDIIDLLN